MKILRTDNEQFYNPLNKSETNKQTVTMQKVTVVFTTNGKNKSGESSGKLRIGDPFATYILIGLLVEKLTYFLCF